MASPVALGDKAAAAAAAAAQQERRRRGGGRGLWAVALVGAAVALWAARTAALLGALTPLPAFTDGACVLVGAEVMANSEDLAPVRDGLVLVAVGDLHKAFRGHVDAAPGALYTVDVQSGAAVRVPLAGMPAGVPFQPHGIYLSNATQRVYAVSHGLAQGDGSRVWVLRVADPALGVAGGLVFVRTVQSPLFQAGAINDVVEGANAGELYVTEWLQVPMPARGQAHPATWRERWNLVYAKLLFLYWPGGRVFRCTYAPDPPPADAADAAATPAECVVAAEGFYMANGITRDPATGRVFVSDVTAKHVRTLVPAPDGRLRDAAPPIALPVPADNLEWRADDAAGRLDLGVLTAPYLAIGEGQWIVPGAYGTVHFSQTASASAAAAVAVAVDAAVLVHDGTKLSQVSAAIASGGKAVLGSPYSPGVLVCPLPLASARTN
jgi:hypothetical protein